jgi:hypothetical protein
LKTDVFNIFKKEGNKAAVRIAELAVNIKSMLKQVLEGATSENKRIKNASAKCLREISRISPQKLYNEFNFFVKLINGDDTILKWNAIEVVSNLTEVDSANKFNAKILNIYFALLSDESMVTAANTITALGKVALNKPRLRNMITDELVKVDTLPHSAECRNILAGHTMIAFEKYVDEVKDKKEIKLFAEKHLKNKKNSTRKKAEKFYSSL